MIESDLTMKDDSLRKSAIGLYTFLKEFTELRSKTTRSFEDYKHVLWLANVPREAGCDCAVWKWGQEEVGDD